MVQARQGRTIKDSLTDVFRFVEVNGRGNKSRGEKEESCKVEELSSKAS